MGEKYPAEKIIDKNDVDETPLDNCLSWTDVREMLDCFNCLPDKEYYFDLPENMIDNNQLDMEIIKKLWDADDALLQHAPKCVDQYMHKRIGMVYAILCYVKQGDSPNNWKIALPENLLQPTIKWFHQVTGHPGRKRLFMQISSCYYHRDICLLVDKFYCEHCQRNRLSGTGHGLLPECKLCSVHLKNVLLT